MKTGVGERCLEIRLFHAACVEWVEVVEPPDLSPLGEQPVDDVRADEAGGAGHKYAMGLIMIVHDDQC